jgi:hypothetical protein
MMTRFDVLVTWVVAIFFLALICHALGLPIVPGVIAATAGHVWWHWGIISGKGR